MWLLYVKIYVLTIKISKIFLTHAFTLSQQSDVHSLLAPAAEPVSVLTCSLYPFPCRTV